MINLKKILIETTLYHGTTIKAAKDIEKHGLYPDVGEFVKNAYGDYDTELEDVVFAADKRGISKAVGAMVFHVGQELGKDFHDVTDEEIKKYGALVKIKDGDNIMSKKDEEDPYDEDHPMSVEPGDYYSRHNVSIDDILTGPKMITVLKRYGAWPRTWGPDKFRNMVYHVIRFLVKNHPEKDVKEILDYLKTQPKRNIENFFYDKIYRSLLS